MLCNDAFLSDCLPKFVEPNQDIRESPLPSQETVFVTFHKNVSLMITIKIKGTIRMSGTVRAIA